MTNEKQHIAIASDLAYLVHAATLVRSILEHNWRHGLVFHLLTMDKRVMDDNRLKQFIQETSSESVCYEIHYVDEMHPFIQSVPEGGTIKNRATLLRLMAPSLIDVEKLLYLDSDMIVLGDLAPLFALDMEGKVMAAVSDLFGSSHVIAKGLGLQYFNAGTLLFNVPAWKANNCLEKVLAFTLGKFTELFTRKKHYGDQDILNSVFQGQVRYVHPKYNAVNPLFLRRCDFYGKMFDEAHDQPVIVHFAGGAKPWNAWDIHPYAKKYRYYRQMTPWRDVPLSKSKLAKKIALWPLKWFKYHCQQVFCPLSDLVRRIIGYSSRIIPESRVKYWIEQTDG